MPPLTEQELNTPGGQSTDQGGFRTGFTPNLEPEPAPEQIVEPPQTPTQLIELEEPVDSPTVISTDSMRQQLLDAQERLNTIKAEQEAGQQPQPEAEQPETVPQPDKEPSETDFIDEYTRETNKLLDQRKNEFNRFMSRSDNLLKSQVRSIQGTFDQRRQQAEKVAANAKAATNVLGARTGRLRYAPEIQRGIITGQENSLIETLASIDAAEQAAIASAETAAFNRDYGTFLDKIDSLDSIRKEREKTLNELEEAMKTENQRREDEAETLRQETLIIEQFAAGVTDPVELFQALNGEVPYDMIVDYVGITPGFEAGGELEFKTGTKYQPAGYFNTKTGDFTPISGTLSGGGSYVGVNPNKSSSQDFPTKADLETMTTDERDFVNKVMRQLPTKLKDSEQEKIDRMREALFDYRRGRGIQEVVDELNGYVVQDQSDAALANVFRSYAVGSGVELSEISAAINNNNPEQAMTAIENAKLRDADMFFAPTDEARIYVDSVKRAKDIYNEFNKEDGSNSLDTFLGSWDGRQFKVERFFGRDATTEERVALQSLASQLQLINSPLRVNIAGTAATKEEMARIGEIQAEITDQPETMMTKLDVLSTNVLAFHNQARSQRGLPIVDSAQLTDNDARIELYRSKAEKSMAESLKNESNSDFLSNYVSGGDGADSLTNNSGFFNSLSE